MTSRNPWGEIEIPKALEKEHKAELKAKRARKKQHEEDKAWFRGFYERYAKQASRDPKTELAEKGYTVVDDKDQLIEVLQSILDRGGPVDIIYEEPDDEKDLS